MVMINRHVGLVLVKRHIVGLVRLGSGLFSRIPIFKVGENEAGKTEYKHKIEV
jgi:hypothetical protein